MKATADEVRAAMIAANITSVDHHDCGGCGYMTQYLREGETLYFDPGCWCSSYSASSPEPRDWSDAADWINMQSNAEWRDKLRVRFGLPPETPAAPQAEGAPT